MIDRPPHLRALADACLIEEVRASLRHSLRNRLGAVRNATFYIRKKVDGTGLLAADARVPRFFDMIDSEVGEATKLLDSKNPFEPSPAVTALVRGAVENVLAATRPERSVTVSFAPGEEVEAGIERLELELAFFCLLENAIESARSSVEVEVRRGAEGAVVTVADDGPGFAAGARERAFELFFSTRPGRAGLGLNVAKRISERWGGGVSIDAAPAAGASVSLRVPSAGGAGA